MDPAKLSHLGAAAALLLSSLVYCVTGSCPQGSEWIEYNSNCYYWSRTKPENWFKAELTCQNYGGHLASVGSLSDNNFLLRLTQCSASFWIGLVSIDHSLKGENRGYEWWDGRQHNYTALYKQGVAYYDCVYFHSNGVWYNYFCQYSITYVCMAPAVDRLTSDETHVNEAVAPGPSNVEYLQADYSLLGNSTQPELTTPMPTVAPQRCPPGWQLLDNSCYYVTFNKTNYFNAQMSCQAMGATVTSILTPREHLLLTVTLGCNSPAWIGLEKARPCFKEPSKDHCWVWNDRSPTVYLEWASGQTLDRRDAECVILDGKWKVVNCYADYGYICKRHAREFKKLNHDENIKP